MSVKVRVEYRIIKDFNMYLILIRYKVGYEVYI